MGLTDAEGKAFWPIYDAYQKELMTLGDRKLKLIMKYAEAHKTMSNEVAKELLDEYLAIEADVQKARQAYLPKFRGRPTRFESRPLLSAGKQNPCGREL